MRLLLKIVTNIMLLAIVLNAGIPLGVIWLSGIIAISFGYTFFLYRRMTDRWLAGEIVIRRASTRTSYFTVLMILATAFIVFVFMNVNNGLLYITFFSLLTINELIEERLKEKLNFDSLLINTTFMQVNRISVIKRDLTMLKKIGAIDLGDFLVFRFEGASPVYIERSQYPREELWTFIETAMKFGDFEVTPGVLEKFNRR